MVVKTLRTPLALFLVALLSLGSAVFNVSHANSAEPALTVEPTVNINTASADELAATLVGVGKTKAEEIVRERERNGSFTKPEDLTRVKGIGSATLEKNRARIQLE